MVRKRNNDIIEEKKNKTLWKLEKIAVKGGSSLERGNAGSPAYSQDRGGSSSRKHWYPFSVWLYIYYILYKRNLLTKLLSFYDYKNTIIFTLVAISLSCS